MGAIMTTVERLEFARTQLECSRSGLAAMHRQNAARPVENELQAQLRAEAIARSHAEIARWEAEVAAAEQRSQWQPAPRSYLNNVEETPLDGMQAMRTLERRYAAP